MKKNYKIVHFIQRKIILSGLLFCLLSIQGQIRRSDNTMIEIDWDIEKYYPNPYTEKSSIKVPSYIKQKMARGGGCASFIVNYSGFTPEAEAAFQYAVDIWSNAIESPIPIRVSATFSPLDPGVLGSAGAANFIALTGPGIPANTAFPIALAEKLIEEEIMDGPVPSTDIIASFSSIANFYFGLDASPPGNQIDFVSVVMHELGHGLGMIGFGRIPTDMDGNPDPNPPIEGVLRNSDFTSVWDNFIENGSQTAITSFADPSAALLAQFTGNDLFSNGPIATAQNGGIKPPTYAPSPFNPGSSYSHWDENAYPAGDPNSLMSPFISQGEGIHDPGMVTLGFMEDMGWSICGGSLSVDSFSINTVLVNPNPFTSSIFIQLDTSSNDDYRVSIQDLNGRAIFNTIKSAVNGEIVLTDLNYLENSLYFIEITNTKSGASITKKVIKN